MGVGQTGSTAQETLGAIGWMTQLGSTDQLAPANDALHAGQRLGHMHMGPNGTPNVGHHTILGPHRQVQGAPFWPQASSSRLSHVGQFDPLRLGVESSQAGQVVDKNDARQSKNSTGMDPDPLSPTSLRAYHERMAIASAMHIAKFRHPSQFMRPQS